MLRATNQGTVSENQARKVCRPTLRTNRLPALSDSDHLGSNPNPAAELQEFEL